MTLHPGVRRNHHTADARARTAPTSAPTSPSQVEFTEALQPLLRR